MNSFSLFYYLRKKYDAVIIGAGIAGLTAEAYLAKSGAKIILCEQSRRVGGLFNSFWHKGYLFEDGIMRWSYVREKSYNYGSFLQVPKSVGTPIPNLFITRQWVFSPGGSPIAVLTGCLAADRALKGTSMKQSSTDRFN